MKTSSVREPRSPCHIRSGASLTALVAASIWSTGVLAQTGAGVSDTAQSRDSGAANGEIGEIIVTAQRREQSLQSVPIAVTVISPTEMQNLDLRTIDSIQTVTPDLIFNTGYAFPQTYIRGIGALAALGGLEQPVSTYIDGAYVPRSVGTVFDLVDIGSVEVLKGPQGTLYGRNATGGAILVTRADPTDKLESFGSAEYGRFDHFKADSTLNVPVNDQLALRFVAGYSTDNGFLRNVYTGQEDDGRRSLMVRVKALWTPSSEFSALLSTEYDDTTLYSPAPGRQLSTGVGCLPCGLGVATPPGFYTVNNDFDEDRPGYSFDTTLRLKYEAGPLSYQSITAYRVVTFDRPVDRGGTDSDTSPIPLLRSFGFFSGETYSEDLQVSSQFGGVFDFLAGGQVVSDRSLVDFGLAGLALGLPYSGETGSIANTEQRTKTNSYAVFEENYIHPVEHMTITLGGRYTRDQRKIDTGVNPDGVAALDPGGPSIFSQSVSYSKFTPRAVIAYDLGLVNLYASFTQGFKAGGFNTPAYAPQTVPILPEKMTSYEIGAKFASADRRTRIDVAAFRYIDKDAQVSSVDILTGGQVITNASSIHGAGFEMDLDQRVQDWLTISSGGAYLHAFYAAYPNASVFDLTGSGYVSGVADLGGTRVPRAPRWTGFVSPNFQAPIGDNLQVRLSPVLRYTTSYDFEPDGGGPEHNDQQRALALINLSGGVGPTSGRYEVGFYVDNLTNRQYYNLIVTGNFGAAGYAAMPRTYGARLKFKF
jgi:iron complex outermembrane receptor protein